MMFRITHKLTIASVWLAFLACTALYLLGAPPVYADAPITTDDTYTTTEDVTLVVTLPISGVLANDTDADGDTLSATVQTAPSHGALSLNLNGTFIYTPTQDYNGTDSFEYEARDSNRPAATAYWPFEESSGPTATDVTGNGHDGTWKNGPITSTNVPLTTTFVNSYSLAFDGTDDLVTIDRASDINDGTQLERTVTAWFSVTDKSLTSHQVIWEEGGMSNGLNIYIYDGTLYAWDWRNGNGTWLTTSAISSMRWHHVALVLDNDYLQLYLDGQLVDSGTGQLLVNHANANGIGGVNGDSAFHNWSISGGGGYFSGLIDDVRVYNLVLSAAEVAETMTDQPPFVDQGTVTLNITAVNDPPVAVDDEYKIEPDVPRAVAAPGVLENDSDIDSATITATLLAGTGPSHGSLDLDLDGSFVYTPNTSFTGWDNFTYIVSDGVLTDTATVTLGVMKFCFAEIDGDTTTDFSSVFGEAVQLAVDAAAPGDTVKVAGDCENVQARAGMSQTVYISKSLTLQGGYTTTGWLNAPDPDTYPTLLNAVDLGRVVVITGTALDVTVDGFEITGGGEGIYVDVKDDAAIVINDNFIRDNNATGLWADVENRTYLQITHNDVMSNTDTGSYGGIYAYGSLSTTLVISDNNIVSNTAGDSYGGAYIELEDFAQFTIKDNVVMSNTATNQYGGLYFDAEYQANGTFDRNQVVGNTASGSYGGAYFYLGYGSSSTFYDNEIRNNFAGGSYGGLYLYPYYNTHITGDNLIIADNEADSYGGGYWDVEYNASVNLPNTKITGNEATAGSYGGLFFYDYNGSVITATDMIIENNQASSNYGGFYLDLNDGGERFIAPGSQIISNTAGSSYGGGRIDSDDGAFVDLTRSRIISNAAQNGNGGGLYFDSLEYGSTALLDYTTFISNTAGGTGDGGGLYVSDVYAQVKVGLSHAEFMTNTAGGSGGGAYFSYGPNYNGQVTLSYAHFINNTAGNEGGGLWMGDNYYNNWVTAGPSMPADHLEVIRNTARGDGGGIYLYDIEEGAQAILDDSVFQENTADGDGGALYSNYCGDGCYFSLSRSEFYSNTANNSGYGGAIYFYEAEYGSEAHFEDNVFINNKADGDGGAFYADDFAYEGSLVWFSRNRVISNTAGSDGGGVYIDELTYYGGTAYFEKNEIISNTADGTGGGLYIGYVTDYGGEVHLNDNRIENNQSNGDGGGMIIYEYGCYEGGDVEFKRNTFIDNVAVDGDGGGLYMEEIESGCRVWFQNNIITGNVISSTSAYDGGGMWMYSVDEGSFMWMTGNQINDNIATGDGGGFYFDSYVGDGSLWYFENNELQRNWAGGDGGGFYFDDSVDDGASIYFNRNLVNDNVTLGNGGGGYFDSGIVAGNTADFIGNQFNSNTAGDDYGALYMDDLDNGTLFRFWDNEVIGNRAGITETVYVNAQVFSTATSIMGGDGGGLWFESIAAGSEAHLRNNHILNNTAYVTYTDGITPTQGEYGGVYADVDSTSGLLTMEDNIIEGNTGQHNFGGVFIELYDASRVVMTHNVISANTAMSDNAGLYIMGEDDSQYFLERNQILNNTAGDHSVGLSIINNDLTDPLWGWSINNLIADNTGGSQLEVGVYVESADFRSLNDTVADNGTYGVWMTGTLTSTAYLSNTILWGHTWAFTKTGVVTYTDRFTMLASYSDIEGGWTGTGNLNTDPVFVGSGDYHLQLTSPVIDQADAAIAPARDLDNIPRPVPVGGSVDMGCYEYHLSGVTVTGEGLLAGDPGTWVTHTITITNDGNAEDEFTLSLSGNVWTATLSVDSVTMAADAHTTVTVAVYVAAEASAGDTDSVNVDAVSLRNAWVVDSDSVDTEANLVPDVAVTPDNNAVGDAGRTQIYHHVVENLGNGTETFDLNAISSQGWTVYVLPASITLGEGLTGTVEVRLIIPAGTGGLVDTTTLTATASSDGSVMDRATDTTTVVNNTDIGITVTDTSEDVGVGNTHVYSFTVTNNASVTDTLGLTYTSSAGWVSGFGPDSVTLGPGASATIYVTVTTPSAGTDGDIDTTVVEVTSGNDSSVQESVTLVTTLDVVTALTLTPDRSAILGVNTTHVYTHTLTNTGSQTDTIAIASSSSRGWLVDWNPQSVTLGAGASATVYVTVTTPVTGTAGMTEQTIIVAISGQASSVQTSVNDATTLAIATALTLTPDRSATLGVNETQVYTHTLTNTGDQPDIIAVAATSSQGWLVNWTPQNVTLGAGASATVYVTVTTPITGQDGVADLTTITATSNNDPHIKARANDITSLDIATVIALTPDNTNKAALSSAVVYTHTLTNHGDQADIISLTALSSQGWNVTFSPNNVNLAPNTSTTVYITITTPAAGNDGDADMTTVIATSSNDTSVKTSANDVTILTLPTETPTYTLTVLISPTVGGSVTLNPPGGVYAENTVVTLTAVPAETYQFMGWTGDLLSAANPTAVTMGRDMTITANFSQTGFTIHLPLVLRKP